MKLDELHPPENLISDFRNLQLTIADDHTGDKTRVLYNYMKTCEQKCMGMLVREPDFEQKRFAQTLADAFSASAQIMLLAWQNAHDAELAV